jgi:hypothetical protein
MGIKMVENEVDVEDFALLQSILCPTLDTDSPRLPPRQQKMGIRMVENEADEEDFALLQSILCPTLDTDSKRLETGLAKRNLSHTGTGSSIQCEGSTNESEDAELHSILKKIEGGVHDSCFKPQQPATTRNSFSAVCA